MNNATYPAKITGLRRQHLFFALCWTAYFSTYIGRLNFTASLAAISAAAGFSQSELGLVSSGFFVGYGIFQLVWGFAGDRLDPVRMVFSGVLCSGLLNLSMACASSPVLMAVIWTLNGAAQSAVWSPLLRLTVERLPGVEAMRASVRYSTTVPFGTLAAYGLAALCSAMGCWRAVFAAAGLFLTAIALCWLRGMRVLAPPLPAAPARSAVRAAARPLPHRLPAVLALICLAALASGMIRDGIQTWTPTYLHDIYGLDNTFAIVLTFTLPLVNLCGVYMGKWANDHIFHSEAVTAAAAFLAACALLAAPALGVRLPLWACLALLGLCAALMLAVNTMLVTLVPLRLQNTGRVSALSGLLNSATYAGSTLSGYGMGLLLERSGWPAALPGLCAGALAASLLCAAAAHGWKRLRG